MTGCVTAVPGRRRGQSTPSQSTSTAVWRTAITEDGAGSIHRYESFHLVVLQKSKLSCLFLSVLMAT